MSLTASLAWISSSSSNNSLSSLPATVFDGLDDSLGDLYIERNSITSLDVNLFDGLTGLNVLTLSYNELTTVPDDLFDDTTVLLYLSLNNNMILEPPRRYL